MPRRYGPDGSRLWNGRKGCYMPRRYGPDGSRLWNGKAPEDFNQADVYRFMAETEAVLQKQELLGGRDDAKKIAQQLAEGAARPAPAKGKEARDDR